MCNYVDISVGFNQSTYIADEIIGSVQITLNFNIQSSTNNIIQISTMDGSAAG